MKTALIPALVLAFALVTGAQATEIKSSVSAADLPNPKRTPLGLYLTAQDAHAALQSSPDIIFIDVRDPVEVSFIGHAEGVDAIVPLGIATHRFDARGGRYAMVGNRNFLPELEAAIAREKGTRSSPVFLICRAGYRSAHAARQLIAAGYTNVWSLVEGFEGDRDRKTGQPTVNGWRNAGLPWRYKIPASVGWQGGNAR